MRPMLDRPLMITFRLASTPMVLAWIAQYGYAAVFAGVLLESAFVPVPGETIAFGAAFAAAHGHLSLSRVIATVVVGAVVGDNIGYLLGRRFGRAWLERHGKWVLLSPARLTRMDAFFTRFGPAAVIIARFITGVRVVAAFVAGSARMRWSTFFTYNVAGAVLWATTVCAAGYAVGRGYRHLGPRLGQVGLVVAPTLLLVGLLAVWLWRRTRTHAPPILLLIFCASSSPLGDSNLVQ